MRTVWLVVVVAGVISGTQHALSENDAETIRSIRAQSNEAIARHDAASVGSFLADDYVITISTGAIERSREEHIDSFAMHFEQYPDVVYLRTPTTIIISESYPLAIEHGAWIGSRTTTNGSLKNGGEYTAAWRKTDGVWKIYSELFVALYCRGEGC